MNPSKPYNNNSYAERQVFDAFRHVEMPEAICFHSLHLVSHVEKRISEIDFVLLCNKGIFVFEVKGGSVYQHGGKWYSKTKQKNIGIENPFNQSRSASFSLFDELKLKDFLPPDIPCGYGVLLPNTISIEDSIEFDNSMLAVKANFKGFTSWLSKFIDFWIKKIELPNYLTINQITEIANYLRPGAIDYIDKSAHLYNRLDQKQQQVVTAFENHKRIICEGAAGTGKTLLVTSLAIKYSLQQKKILVLCKSIWLKSYLINKLNESKVVVSTIDSLTVDSRRAFISKYDAAIIDEVPHIYLSNKIHLLDKYICGGIDNGKWILFQDSLNPDYCSHISNQDGVALFKNKCTCELSLDSLYRYSYSHKTLDYVLKKIGAEIVKTRKIKISNIEIILSDSKDKEIENIKNSISMAEKDGFKKSDITILSTKPFNDSIISDFPSSFKENLICIDDFNIRYFPFSKMSFSELEHFKGLENNVIILTDCEQSYFTNATKAYLALTRAAHQQFIILTSDQK